jgi:GNAT superfamily N-acetyltransferase
MHAALAVDGGQALGLVHSMPSIRLDGGGPLPSSDLFVTADARGRGIGRALSEYAYLDAKRGGTFRVYWLTHESNHVAMQLYDRIADHSPFIQYRNILRDTLVRGPPPGLV